MASLSDHQSLQSIQRLSCHTGCKIMTYFHHESSAINHKNRFVTLFICQKIELKRPSYSATSYNIDVVQGKFVQH